MCVRLPAATSKPAFHGQENVVEPQKVTGAHFNVARRLSKTLIREIVDKRKPLGTTGALPCYVPERPSERFVVLLSQVKVQDAVGTRLHVLSYSDSLRGHCVTRLAAGRKVLDEGVCRDWLPAGGGAWSGDVPASPDVGVKKARGLGFGPQRINTRPAKLAQEAAPFLIPVAHGDSTSWEPPHGEPAGIGPTRKVAYISQVA